MRCSKWLAKLSQPVVLVFVLYGEKNPSEVKLKSALCVQRQDHAAYNPLRLVSLFVLVIKQAKCDYVVFLFSFKVYSQYI